jgi:hypothetical protein
VKHDCDTQGREHDQQFLPEFGSSASGSTKRDKAFTPVVAANAKPSAAGDGFHDLPARASWIKFQQRSGSGCMPMADRAGDRRRVAEDEPDREPRRCPIM